MESGKLVTCNWWNFPLEPDPKSVGALSSCGKVFADAGRSLNASVFCSNSFSRNTSASQLFWFSSVCDVHPKYVCPLFLLSQPVFWEHHVYRTTPGPDPSKAAYCPELPSSVQRLSKNLSHKTWQPRAAGAPGHSDCQQTSAMMQVQYRLGRQH